MDFAARRSEFDSESSFSGRSGRHSQYTAGARSMADRSGTEITEYHSYMYAESQDARWAVNSFPELCLVNDLFEGPTAGPRLDT